MKHVGLLIAVVFTSIAVGIEIGRMIKATPDPATGGHQSGLHEWREQAPDFVKEHQLSWVCVSTGRSDDAEAIKWKMDQTWHAYVRGAGVGEYLSGEEAKTAAVKYFKSQGMNCP